MIIDPTLFSDRRKFMGHIDGAVKKYFFARKKCEAKGHISDCCGSVINSHSISKKFLKRIATKDKQVYCFDDRLFGYFEREGRIA